MKNSNVWFACAAAACALFCIGCPVDKTTDNGPPGFFVYTVSFPISATAALVTLEDTNNTAGAAEITVDLLDEAALLYAEPGSHELVSGGIREIALNNGGGG